MLNGEPMEWEEARKEELGRDRHKWKEDGGGRSKEEMTDKGHSISRLCWLIRCIICKLLISGPCPKNRVCPSFRFEI